MRHAHVVGDMQVHGDDTVDGWCWAPDRPRARLTVDVLVEDRVVAGGRAALPRPDLALPGMKDAAHGFRLTLPPGSIDRAVPTLVSARARDCGIVFGRRRLDPERPPAEPALEAMQATLGDCSARMAVVASPTPPPAGRLRHAAGDLGAALPVALGGLGAGVAAARRVLAVTSAPVRLARPAAPRASLLLHAAGPAPPTLARLHALAPATHALPAEVLLLDPGQDARIALVPSLVPGLLLCSRSWDEAARLARGQWLLLLDDGTPSVAGLTALLARLDASDAALAVPGRRAGWPVLPLDLRGGVALAIRRELAGSGEAVEALMERHRARTVVFAEPWP